MMALKKFTMLLTLACTVFAGQLAMGQVETPSARFRPQAVEETDATRPFAQPGIFDYDAQMWSPVEFTNGGQRQPNTGFFFSYERVYSSINRGGQVGPTENPAVAVGSDWGWGNRFEFGWMTEEGSGWDLIYQKANTRFFATGTDILVAQPQVVDTDFSQVEVNKIFRQTLSNGNYFEPYVGFRYFSLSDNMLEDTSQNFNGQGANNRFKLNATNSAPAFQIGGRYNTRRGRYRMAFDGALAAGYNQQTLRATDTTIIGAAIGTSQQSFKSQSFMPALDAQFELAYDLSRDIALRTSVQATYIWDGVNRTNNLTTNLNPFSTFGTGTDVGIFDNDLTAIGLTFGIEWKR